MCPAYPAPKVQGLHIFKPGCSGQWQGQGEIVQCPQSPEIRFQRPLQGLGSGTWSQDCEDCPLRCATLEWNLGGSPEGRRPPSTVGAANCRAAGVGRGCSPVSGLLSSEGPQLVTEEPSLTDSIPEGGLNGEGREFGPGAGDGGLPPPDTLSLYPSVCSSPESSLPDSGGTRDRTDAVWGGPLSGGSPPNSSEPQKSSILCCCLPSALWDVGLVSGAISHVLPTQAWLSSKMVSPVTWVVMMDAQPEGCVGASPGARPGWATSRQAAGCWSRIESPAPSVTVLCSPPTRGKEKASRPVLRACCVR